MPNYFSLGMKKPAQWRASIFPVRLRRVAKLLSEIVFKFAASAADYAFRSSRACVAAFFSMAHIDRIACTSLRLSLWRVSDNGAKPQEQYDRHYQTYHYLPEHWIPPVIEPAL